MPITWNAEAEARLLLGIFDQLKGHKLDYKALAAYMGPGCTVPALHQRLFKLRREAEPFENTQAPFISKNPSPIKKAKKVHYVSDEDDDDAENCDPKFIKDEEDEKAAILDLAD